MQRVAGLVFVLLAAMLAGAHAHAAKIRYTFDGWAGPPLRVYASRAPALEADRPVVIVMHGVERNAREYRDQWHELALTHRFLLLAPEFAADDFPASNGYNLGYQEDAEGRPRPRERWSYAALEPLFDDARRRFGARATRYALYGHSAGAQIAWTIRPVFATRCPRPATCAADLKRRIWRSCSRVCWWDTSTRLFSRWPVRWLAKGKISRCTAG